MSNLKHRIESCFECLTIPRKQIQDRSKEFLQNKSKIILKRFLGKASLHIDHYMINIWAVRGQRLVVIDC